MNNKILIESRSVYGVEKYYVVSEHAAAISALTHKKTLDLSDVRALSTLGFNCVMSGRSEIPACEMMLN